MTWAFTCSGLTLRHSVPEHITDSVISVILPEMDYPASVTVSARAAAEKTSSAWAVMLADGTDTVTVKLTLDPARHFDPFDCSRATVTATAGNLALGSATFSDILASSPGEYNTLSVTVTRSNLSISGGHRRLRHLLDIPYRFITTPRYAAITTSGTVDVSELTTAVIPAPENVAVTQWTPDSIAALLSRHDLKSPEGYWEYLDRNTSPRKAREGGRYRLAIVRSLDRPDSYDILYLSGAAVNAESWKPGMRKGRLIPTDYVDHYDLEWIDATFNLRTIDIHASVEQSSILTLSFPLLDSSLRFSRCELSR